MRRNFMTCLKTRTKESEQPVATGNEFIDEYGYRWYLVPPFGCWEREIDRIAYNNSIRELQKKRMDARNANRLAKGKPRKAPSKFRRSSDRYSEYVKQDLGMSFGEWLKMGGYKREFTGTVTY